MNFKRFDNILAMKTPAGKLIGFHARNLQVAELDENAWQALDETVAQDPTSQEALSELLTWNREIDTEVKDADMKQEVRSLLVNIAQVCNLKCTYCAAGGDGTYGEPMKNIELETLYDQIRMLFHDLKSGETFTITFFGGEPLIAPEAIRAISRFAKLQAAGRGIRVRFAIVTNGTLVNDEIAELLANLQCHVTVSLDGPPEINDIARPTKGGRGSTALTLKGIAKLMKVRDRLGSISAGAVFGKHHVDVLSTYKFLKTFDFDSIKFDFAAEANDSEASEAYLNAMNETADFAYADGGEMALRRIGIFNSYFLALDQQMRVNNHCGAGKSHMTIDGRGRMSACQWFVGKKDDELGHGTKIDHEKLAQYAPRLNELNNCNTCWARFVCGGGCMYVNEVKTGSKHKKDDAFCNRSRGQIAKAIEHYAQARFQDTGA